MLLPRRGVRLPPVKFRIIPLLCLPLLTACRDEQARQQNTELTRRVAALEAQVRALKAAQGRDSVNVNPAAFEAKAAAQNCANALTLALETFRQDSLDRRYPPGQRLALPDACAGQQVNWLKLQAQAYTFTITDDTGQELARQSGP